MVSECNLYWCGRGRKIDRAQELRDWLLNYYFTSMHMRLCRGVHAGPLNPRVLFPVTFLHRLWAVSAPSPLSTYEGVTGDQHHVWRLVHLQSFHLCSGGRRCKR